MWCIQAITEEYRARMYRLLKLYQQGYNPNEPLVCMDEKSKQLLEDSRQPIKAKPGKLEKYDYEYKRKGTCNIFLAVAPKAGMRIVKVTDTRTKEDFAYFIEDLVEKHFRKTNYIQLVLDNLNTHFEGSLVETFGKRKATRLLKKVKFIYTPKHGSWLNMGATCKADVVIVSISLIKGNRETYHSVGSSLPQHARRVIFGCEAREIMYRIAARLSVKAARRELTWKFHPG
jgi:DDE superfamily endonuclease